MWLFRKSDEKKVKYEKGTVLKPKSKDLLQQKVKPTLNDVQELILITDQFLKNRQDILKNLRNLLKNLNEQDFYKNQLEIFNAINQEVKRVYPNFIMPTIEQAQKFAKNYIKYDKVNKDPNLIFNYFDSYLYLTESENDEFVKICNKKDKKYEELLKICRDIFSRVKAHNVVKSKPIFIRVDDNHERHYKRKRGTDVREKLIYYNANIAEIAKIRKILGSSQDDNKLEEIYKNVNYVDDDNDRENLKNLIEKYKKNPSNNTYNEILQIFNKYCDYVLNKKGFELSSAVLNIKPEVKGEDIIIRNIRKKGEDNLLSRKFRRAPYVLTITQNEEKVNILKKVIELGLMRDTDIFECQLSDNLAQKYKKTLNKKVYYIINKPSHRILFFENNDDIMGVYEILVKLYDNNIVLNANFGNKSTRDFYQPWNSEEYFISNVDNAEFITRENKIWSDRHIADFKKLYEIAKNHKLISPEYLEILKEWTIY